MTIKDPIMMPFEIKIDGNGNHTVFENTGNLNKDGETVFKTIGYFSSVPSALKAIAKKKVLDGNKDASIMLSDYASELREEVEKISNCINA